MPSFLSLPIYALELSDKSYKYLRLKALNGEIYVADFGEGEIPAGVIERGEIKKPDVLRDLLAELFLKKQIKYVAISLPEEKGFLRNIKLSGVRESEIQEALALQLEEHVPLPPDDIVFNHSVVKKDKDHFDIVLLAFSQAFVNSYLDLFSSAGALPVLVESELSAALEAIIPDNLTDAAMTMDWGKTRVSFAIAKNRILRFAATIQVGGETLDESISKTLGVDKAAAEDLKKKSGFLNLTEYQKVFQALVPIVTAVREEAEKYITFWQTHSEEKQTPAKLFLLGGDAHLLGLKGYLRKELELDVAHGDPWVNIKFPPYYVPGIEKRDSLRYAASIGLGLHALRRENEF